MAEAYIRARGVTKTYRPGTSDLVVFEDLNLDVERGEMLAWILALYLLGLLVVLPTVNVTLLECLYHPALFAVVLTALLAVWARLHAARSEGWGELRLKYEEAPDPVVHGLNLLR